MAPRWPPCAAANEPSAGEAGVHRSGAHGSGALKAPARPALALLWLALLLAAGAAAALDPHLARQQVELVVEHDHPCQLELVEAHRLADRAP